MGLTSCFRKHGPPSHPQDISVNSVWQTWMYFSNIPTGRLQTAHGREIADVSYLADEWRCGLIMSLHLSLSNPLVLIDAIRFSQDISECHSTYKLRELPYGTLDPVCSGFIANCRKADGTLLGMDNCLLLLDAITGFFQARFYLTRSNIKQVSEFFMNLLECIAENEACDFLKDLILQILNGKNEAVVFTHLSGEMTARKRRVPGARINVKSKVKKLHSTKRRTLARDLNSSMSISSWSLLMKKCANSIYCRMSTLAVWATVLVLRVLRFWNEYRSNELVRLAKAVKSSGFSLMSILPRKFIIQTDQSFAEIRSQNTIIALENDEVKRAQFMYSRYSCLDSDFHQSGNVLPGRFRHFQSQEVAYARGQTAMEETLRGNRIDIDSALYAASLFVAAGLRSAMDWSLVLYKLWQQLVSSALIPFHCPDESSSRTFSAQDELTGVTMFSETVWSLSPPICAFRHVKLESVPMMSMLGMTFSEFYPEMFNWIRQATGISHSEFKSSLCSFTHPFIEFASNSQSGNFFFFSGDGRYLVKTVSHTEAGRLIRFLPSYVRHLQHNPASFLCRMYGLFKLSLNQPKGKQDEDTKIRKSTDKIRTGDGLNTFTKKLSTLGARLLSPKQMSKGSSRTEDDSIWESSQSTCSQVSAEFQDRGSRRFYRTQTGGIPIVDPDIIEGPLPPTSTSIMEVKKKGMDMYFIILGTIFDPHLGVDEIYDLKGSTVSRTAAEDDTVKKDNDWILRSKRLKLSPELGHLFLEAHMADCEFLKDQGIFDYSLLVGIRHLRSYERCVTCEGSPRSQMWQVRDARSLSRRLALNKMEGQRPGRIIVTTSNLPQVDLVRLFRSLVRAAMWLVKIKRRVHLRKHPILFVKEPVAARCGPSFSQDSAPSEDCGWPRGPPQPSKKRRISVVDNFFVETSNSIVVARPTRREVGMRLQRHSTSYPLTRSSNITSPCCGFKFCNMLSANMSEDHYVEAAVCAEPRMRLSREVSHTMTSFKSNSSDFLLPSYAIKSRSSSADIVVSESFLMSPEDDSSTWESFESEESDRIPSRSAGSRSAGSSSSSTCLRDCREIVRPIVAVISPMRSKRSQSVRFDISELETPIENYLLTDRAGLGRADSKGRQSSVNIRRYSALATNRRRSRASSIAVDIGKVSTSQMLSLNPTITPELVERPAVPYLRLSRSSAGVEFESLPTLHSEADMPFNMYIVPSADPREIYFVALIDFITPYGLRRYFHTLWKYAKSGGPLAGAISPVPPRFYCRRQARFVAEQVVSVTKNSHSFSG